MSLYNFSITNMNFHKSIKDIKSGRYLSVHNFDSSLSITFAHNNVHFMTMEIENSQL